MAGIAAAFLKEPAFFEENWGWIPKIFSKKGVVVKPWDVEWKYDWCLWSQIFRRWKNLMCADYKNGAWVGKWRIAKLKQEYIHMWNYTFWKNYNMTQSEYETMIKN